MITQELLKTLLRYDKRSGRFHWKVSRGTCKAGAEAGSFDDGYIVIRIDGRKYRAHQLAHLYITGRWALLVDHKNNVGTDNRWKNLREATHSQNQANRMLHPAAAVPFKGVVKRKGYDKYRARIVVLGKEIHLGMFDSAEAAHQAYLAAAQEHFGEFARAR